MFTKVALFVLLAVAFTLAEEKKPEGGKGESEERSDIEEAWDDIDDDNDDKATKKEFEHYFHENGLPKKLADDAFVEADKSKDNSVSKQEYEAWAKA